VVQEEEYCCLLILVAIASARSQGDIWMRLFLVEGI